MVPQLPPIPKQERPLLFGSGTEPPYPTPCYSLPGPGLRSRPLRRQRSQRCFSHSTPKPLATSWNPRDPLLLLLAPLQPWSQILPSTVCPPPLPKPIHTPGTRAGHSPFLLVLLLVLQEADVAAEVAGTVGAGKGSFPRGMDPPVALQPGCCPECLATDATAMAPGVCVGPAVVLEREQVGQKLGAEGAGVEASGVGLLVVQEAASMAIGAATLHTAKGPLVFSLGKLSSLPPITSPSIIS